MKWCKLRVLYEFLGALRAAISGNFVVCGVGVVVLKAGLSLTNTVTI